MHVTVTEPAAKVSPRDAAIRISVLSTIPAERSVSTARQQNVCTTPTTNAMRSMWISEAQEPVTAKKHCARLSGKPELLVLPVLHFYITINMLDASRLACVSLMHTPMRRKQYHYVVHGGAQENLLGKANIYICI